MTVEAQDLFVFVGAGASRSLPAGLPMFDGLRRQILLDLGLIADGSDPRAKAYAKLAPEVFMLALSRGGVPVVPWLGDVLGAGEPNAAHFALARLATAGAVVWTVNFDHLIERAGGPAVVPCAWPASPADGANLFKPHGTLGGELIVDAEAVLRGLPSAWEDRLRSDVAGRTVVFLGYRGFDLDFQPIWDDVLAAAKDVLWFDLPDPDEDRHKRMLLAGKEAAGRLHLRPPVPSPSTAPPGTTPNPSWDFIHWCREQDLADPDPALVLQLFGTPAPVLPALPGTPYDRAKPVLLGLLGEIKAARAGYRALLRRPAHFRHAARSLLELQLNHGGRSLARALGVVRLLPPVGRLAATRRLAEVKRLTVLSKTGNYPAVLRGTRNLTADSLSTLWILRSAALRSSASLDAAADAARTAWDSARAERHPVRIAHAAFQRTLALMWADRLDEARSCLEQDLDPYAALAANRWLAWADFIRGGLAVRDGDAGAAGIHLQRSRDRFAAEALDDGVASVLVALLAVRRLQGADGEFAAALREVERFDRTKGKQRLRYARKHPFMRHAVLLERAEFARVHTGDTDAALRLYGQVARSPYPLHAAQAHLGLAMLEVERGRPPEHAATALAAATRIGARRHARHARALLSAPGPDRPPEFFFC